MRNFVKKQNGITLIALVVTIIVLIILAGVSIAMLVGDNGIITQAQRADELTTQAQQKEAIELAIASVQAQGTLELDKTKLEIALQSQFGDTSYSLTENGDGSFRLQIAERSYYIDSTGEVITEENMIAIGSAEELKSFRDDVNNGNSYEGKYVYLTGNITLDSSEQWKPIGLYSNDSPTPDDENNKPFSGIFDGKGYEVNGIYINTANKVQGLFGLVESGKITNLGIGENNSITGGIATTGLVGYIYNGSEVVNCYNKANIKAQNNNGAGVVGVAYINCSITDCYNEGDIIGNNDIVGGIVGYTDNHIIIQNCYNIGIINSQGEAGGVVGHAGRNVSINNSYNKGNITGKSEVGGICGNIVSTTSKVSKSYNIGNVKATGGNEESGNSNVGGILGLNSGGNIENSYNTGTIIGVYNNIGGIAGLNRGKIENCYNIGQLSGSVENKGGITGNNDLFETTTETYVGEIYNSYTLSGVTDKIAGTNDSTIGSECSLKSSTELKQIYTALGEAFKQDEDNINQGYPVLAWQ